MNKKSLYKEINSQPFNPIRISLASGESMVVRHPENIVIRDVSFGRTVVVVFEGPEAPYIFEPQAVVRVSNVPRRNSD